MKLWQHLTLVFCLTTSLLSAQNARDWAYRFQNFGLNDGLPSTEVYHVMQDKEKNLWFSTDRGVVKYDGHKFQSYNKSHGLPDLTIFKSYQAEDGKIWFSSFSHELSYFYKDSIYQYSRNKELTAFWNKLGYQHISPHDFFLQGDSIYVGIQKKGMIIIPPKDSIHYLSVHGKTDICYLVLADKRKSYSSYHWLTLKYGKFYFQDSLYHFEDRNPSIRRVMVDYHKKHKTGIISFGSQLFMMIDKDLEEINSFRGQVELSSFVTDIYIDSNNAVWVSTLNHGVVYYSSILEMHKPPVKFLDGHTISGVTEDHEGGYWLSSTDNGVYYLPQPSLKTLKAKHMRSRVNKIIDFKNKIYFGFQNGNISKIDANIISNQWSEYLFKAPIYSLFNYKNEHLFIFSDAMYRPFKKGLLYHSIDKRGAVKSAAVNSKGDTFVATSSGISKLKPGFDFRKNGYYTRLFKARASKITFDQHDTLWLGTRSGLFYATPPYNEPVPYTENIGDVRDVEKQGSHLAYVSKEGSIYLESHYGKARKLPNITKNYLNCLTFEGDSILWVGGSKGLLRYSIKNEVSVSLLNEHSGLVNNDVKSLLNIRDTLWIGTADGINFIPLKELSLNKNKPKLQIESILVDGKQIIKEELSYNENKITISLKGVNHKKKDQILFQYRLSNKDSIWNDVYDQKLILQELKPDEYTVQFRAINLVNQISSNIQTARFVILPPFWKTWWFISLIILVSVGIVIWVFTLRIKRLREKNLLQKEVFENEKKALIESQKALRAQMNPHFLFNSLNSVYHLIIKDDLAGAKKTITKISKLMRGLLEGSREELINLEDEVTLLTDYLNLQKLQFETDFDFKISVDEELEEDDYQIHSMLIQPFIENAIIHGLLPLRSRAAFISIDFNMSEETKIKVTIEDNGIGRKASEELKKDKKHKSLAMTVTQERLAHLSSYDKEYYFCIQDLEEGTLVELIIPLV